MRVCGCYPYVFVDDMRGTGEMGCGMCVCDEKRKKESGAPLGHEEN